MFDRVVVIEHPYRPERLEAFWGRLPSDWPFQQPVPLRGVDGRRCLAPSWWRGSPAAWGATAAHHRAIEWGLSSGSRSLLVLEDDAVFVPDFSAAVLAVLSIMLADAGMIYLGGQHLREAISVNGGVVRCRNTNRAHAYGLVGPGMARTYEWLHAGEHWARPHVVDHHYGRLHESGSLACYAARRWLVGQAEGWSDTEDEHKPERWWRDTRMGGE